MTDIILHLKLNPCNGCSKEKQDLSIESVLHKTYGLAEIHIPVGIINMLGVINFLEQVV